MDNQVKISDVTKALKKAGFKPSTVDEAFTASPRRSYFKYRGSLYISGNNVGFTIHSKADAKIFGAYSTSAINETGACYETLTNVAQFFYPRLFGYLAGEVTESEIIAQICN